jgi:hypothetical protein
MRAIATATLLSLLLAAAAAAQNNVGPVRPQPAPRAGATGVPTAPVGHRQPTLDSLPPAVRQNEDTVGEGRGAGDPLGPVPNICNGC